ncbi:MAG: SDR family oxidoreductase, partial [Sciscionella sp.]
MGQARRDEAAAGHTGSTGWRLNTLSRLSTPLHLRGAVALVTGASSGIGAATAVRLADAGARLILHGQDGPRLAAMAERTGGVPLPADFSGPASLLAAVEQARHHPGGVDVLVNNAGIGWAGQLGEMTGEQVRRLVAVNLLAPLELTRALAPGMVAKGRGHIVFVTSIAGRSGVAGEAVYAATKAGLDAFA